MSSAESYLHYGWPASPYSAKSRAALRVSGLPWEEVRPHALTFSWLQAQVGRKVIPVMRTPEGEFVQDSSRIVDVIEAASGRQMTPEAPLPRVLALLVEVFADEWLIYAAMYFRWQYRGGDLAFMARDFGGSALPGLPPRARQMAGHEVAKAMRRYLPIMGLNETTGPAIEHETRTLLAQLDAALGTAPYVLGEHPCIADYALYGPIAAHIGRDPWSAEVVDQFPAVRIWIDRLHEGAKAPPDLGTGWNLELDEPRRALLSTVFRLGVPLWTRAYELGAPSVATGEMPRRLGQESSQLHTPKGESVEHVHTLTAVSLWKLQRGLRALSEAGEERGKVEGELKALGAGALCVLGPLDFELESIAWRKSPTLFGPLAKVVDRFTPWLGRLPPQGPVHARRRGPVSGLG